VKVRDASEKDGKLLEKRETVILMATDYAPTR
jgi:hypothetical protein